MDQLTLGELIDKLEPLLSHQERVQEKYGHKAYVEFDFSGTFPIGLSSWRGVYAELAIKWAGGDYGDDYNSRMELDKFVEMLKGAIGKEYTGWKGGEFTMSRRTKLWVANPGLVGNTGIVDVLDEEYLVILKTGYFD